MMHIPQKSVPLQITNDLANIKAVLSDENCHVISSTFRDRTEKGVKIQNEYRTPKAKLVTSTTSPAL